MEIVVRSKNSFFQQKFHKKLHHFNKYSQPWQCDVKKMIQLVVLIRTKKSDY